MVELENFECFMLMKIFSGVCTRIDTMTISAGGGIYCKLGLQSEWSHSSSEQRAFRCEALQYRANRQRSHRLVPERAGHSHVQRGLRDTQLLSNVIAKTLS